MSYISALAEQCNEIEKTVQDLKVESVGVGNEQLEDIALGLEKQVVELIDIVDIIKNKVREVNKNGDE